MAWDILNKLPEVGEYVFESQRKRTQIARLVGQLKSNLINELKVRVPKLGPEGGKPE